MKRPRIISKRLARITPAQKTNGNELVTIEMLDHRRDFAAFKGFKEAAYLRFCRHLLQLGLVVHLYEARKTFSKYVTVSQADKAFKVRFSDHPPISLREAMGDCDFFVGKANYVWTNTAAALKATLEYFELPLQIPEGFGKPVLVRRGEANATA